MTQLKKAKVIWRGCGMKLINLHRSNALALIANLWAEMAPYTVVHTRFGKNHLGSVTRALGKTQERGSS